MLINRFQQVFFNTSRQAAELAATRRTTEAGKRLFSSCDSYGLAQPKGRIVHLQGTPLSGCRLHTPDALVQADNPALLRVSAVQPESPSSLGSLEAISDENTLLFWPLACVDILPGDLLDRRDHSEMRTLSLSRSALSSSRVDHFRARLSWVGSPLILWGEGRTPQELSRLIELGGGAICGVLFRDVEQNREEALVAQSFGWDPMLFLGNRAGPKVRSSGELQPIEAWSLYPNAGSTQSKVEHLSLMVHELIAREGGVLDFDLLELSDMLSGFGYTRSSSWVASRVFESEQEGVREIAGKFMTCSHEMGLDHLNEIAARLAIVGEQMEFVKRSVVHARCMIGEDGSYSSPLCQFMKLADQVKTRASLMRGRVNVWSELLFFNDTAPKAVGEDVVLSLLSS